MKLIEPTINKKFREFIKNNVNYIKVKVVPYKISDKKNSKLCEQYLSSILIEEHKPVCEYLEKENPIGPICLNQNKNICKHLIEHNDKNCTKYEPVKNNPLIDKIKLEFYDTRDDRERKLFLEVNDIINYINNENT